MKLRFSIRDLLWLTLVLAICAAWWIDGQRRSKNQEEIVRYVETQLQMAQSELSTVQGEFSTYRAENPQTHRTWSGKKTWGLPQRKQ